MSANTALETLNSFLRIKPVMEAFVNQALTQSPFLDIMRKGKASITKMGGDYIHCSLNYGAGQFKPWAGYGDITVAPTYTTGASANDIFAEEALYPWAYWVATDIISYKNWMEIEKSEDSLADYAKTRLENISNTVSRQMEDNLFAEYTGSAYTAWGLPDIVNTTDPTHYGAGLGKLAVADNAKWVGQSFTYHASPFGSSDLSPQMMHCVNLASMYGSTKIIITTQTIFEKYCEEAYGKSGYIVSDTIPTSLGFKSGGSFNGIPVVWSDKCTSGTMYFLDTDFLKLVTHPDATFKNTGWQQYSTINLDMIALITLSYNLVCNKREAQVKMISIT